MLQIQVIRENKEEVVRRLAKKKFKGLEIIDQIVQTDADRRSTQTELDSLKADANAIAKQIGEMMKSGKKAEAEDLKNKSTALKETEKALQERLNGAVRRRTAALGFSCQV